MLIEKTCDSLKRTLGLLTEEVKTMVESPKMIETVIILHFEIPVGVPILIISNLKWLKSLRN